MHAKHVSRAAALLAVAALAGPMTVAAVASGDHPARHARGGEHGDHHARLPKSYVLPGNALFPEGIAYDRTTGNFYTGSAADGTIVRGNILEPQAEVFSPAGADGRTAALGMRTDRRYLYVAGGSTGTFWIYDKENASLVAKLSNGLGTGTFVNDLALTRSGVFVTDSSAPYLWRVTPGPDGKPVLENWLAFSGTAFQYTTGFNANGIVATPDGRFLIIDATNTGRLYRIDIATKAVVEIGTGGADLTMADGLELVGHDLYVARNTVNQLVKLELADDWASGTVETVTTSPRFDVITGVVAVGDRLLVVNSQFEHLGTPTPPTLPFTITSITRP
jgi:sugar lactone lactonase YvrE